ncbi:MAG: small integral membrane protein [Limisphaerales bacterium]|nr:MAG: small integral membrane protein [Limisphaerales bacterium]KAG0508493.1 MAG: small integral membrane protein [Limisphaerales bacterium]TXT48919.1 MAG: small integral membrane protein [Limisphaerales bacterium]
MTAPNVVLWVYIVLLVAGGLVGFLKAGSKASLIASVACALPLVLALLLGWPNGTIAALLGVLAIVFGLRCLKAKKFMPMGLMMVLSLTAVLLRSVLR